MIKFLLAGFKTLYCQFKKSQADRMSSEMKKLKSDTLLLALHGSAMNYYNALYPMLKYFYEKKIKFIPLEYDFTDDMDDICKGLLKHEKMINRHKKVFFIGHSYGGLVARYFVRKYLRDKTKFHIITVAAVNSGVVPENYGIFDSIIYHTLSNAQPELKGSVHLNYLDKNKFKKTKITNITGDEDTLVPEEVSLLHGKKPDIVLKGKNHLSIIYSKELFDSIYGVVKRTKH